jgi:hypothetical protein
MISPCCLSVSPSVSLYLCVSPLIFHKRIMKSPFCLWSVPPISLVVINTGHFAVCVSVCLSMCVRSLPIFLCGPFFIKGK